MHASCRSSLARRDDEATWKEALGEVESLERDIDSLEVLSLLGGEFDENPAILEVHAGEGGTDSQDWAEMLLRMYLRWAERRGFKTELVEATAGEEAGIKSATVTVDGRHAYGLLAAERGVHRLVRISPFDPAKSRHTSFASVDVTPEVEDDVEVEIDPDDLRIDTYRSSGAGGQHVNVTDSAVRITHLPSGIVVSCQNERSQMQNRAVAMRILKSRLLAKAREEREAEMSALSRREARDRFRLADPFLRSASVPDGERPPHGSRDGERPGVLDGDHRHVHRGGAEAQSRR